jgi:hypothetical protein
LYWKSKEVVDSDKNSDSDHSENESDNDKSDDDDKNDNSADDKAVTKGRFEASGRQAE